MSPTPEDQRIHFIPTISALSGDVLKFAYEPAIIYILHSIFYICIVHTIILADKDALKVPRSMTSNN